MAVGLVNLDRKEEMLISLYWDTEENPVLECLKNALDYAVKRGYSVLIAADSNSHSNTKGHETNGRGAQLEEFIQDSDLVIHNVG